MPASHTLSLLKKIMKDINVEFGKPQHTVFIDRYGVSDNLTFNFKKAIGKGAFGVVVEVELKDKRRTALKRMFLDCRYRNRELSTLLKINHPHIVELLYYRTFDWGTEGHYLDLIFELCDTSLEDMVKDKTKLSEETILKFYEQSLDALGYLHSKNIVHRDIKPGNIIIKGEDVKICDFGSAKIINDNDYNEPYICTRYYRSPENLMGRENYSSKIDIWSLAVTMIELLSGHVLFKGTSALDQLLKIRKLLFCNPESISSPQTSERIFSVVSGLTELKRLRMFFCKSIVFDSEERLDADALISLEI